MRRRDPPGAHPCDPISPDPDAKMQFRRLVPAAAVALATLHASIACAQEGAPVSAAPDTAEMLEFIRAPAAMQDRWERPFAVEASGRVAPRPPRGEVVHGGAAPLRAAAAPPHEVTADARPTDDEAAAARAERPRAAGDEPPAAPAGGATHRVEEGETFTGIAHRYGATPAQLRVLNPGLDWENLRPGDVLLLPAAAGEAGAPAAPPTRRAPGDVTAPPPPATPPAPRPAGARTHTVAAGETLFGIARRYGVTAAQIRALNAQVDWDTFPAGTILTLPASAADRTAEPEAAPRDARIHVVEPGETLFGIARRYGVGMQALQQANRLETDQVRAGQRLVIPAPAP